MNRNQTGDADPSLKRVFVSLPDGLWKILKKNYKGKIGEGDSELIRNIVVSFLLERGYFVNNRGENTVNALYGRLDYLDDMISSLVFALEENGVIKLSELESRARKKRIEKRIE